MNFLYSCLSQNVIEIIVWGILLGMASDLFTTDVGMANCLGFLLIFVFAKMDLVYLSSYV